MRILRTVSIVVVFLLGVLMATANTARVQLVYLPELPFTGSPLARSIDLPLYLLVLLVLTVGVLLGGLTAAIEQIRLRAGLRRSRKEIARLTGELRGIKERLELTRAELEQERRGSLRHEPTPATLPQPRSGPQTAAQSAPDDDSSFERSLDEP